MITVIQCPGTHVTHNHSGKYGNIRESNSQNTKTDTGHAGENHSSHAVLGRFPGDVLNGGCIPKDLGMMDVLFPSVFDPSAVDRPLHRGHPPVKDHLERLAERFIQF